MIKRIFNDVLTVESKGQVFIPFSDVDVFTSVCDAFGLVVCGGAFLSDMSGQYFYLEYRREAV